MLDFLWAPLFWEFMTAFPWFSPETSSFLFGRHHLYTIKAKGTALVSANLPLAFSSHSILAPSILFPIHINYICLDQSCQVALCAVMGMFYSAPFNTVATSHTWLLSVWSMAYAAEDATF